MIKTQEPFSQFCVVEKLADGRLGPPLRVARHAVPFLLALCLVAGPRRAESQRSVIIIEFSRPIRATARSIEMWCAAVSPSNWCTWGRCTTTT